MKFKTFYSTSLLTGGGHGLLTIFQRDTKNQRFFRTSQLAVIGIFIK